MTAQHVTPDVTQREPDRDALLTSPHQALVPRWPRQPLQQVSTRVKGLMVAALVALTTTVSLQLLPAQAFSRTDTPATESIGVVALSALPAQAQDTHRRILAGGPFRFDKDGIVFGNRERQLPRQKRGYYREYTVVTPGVRHRGARRIVCGGLVVQSPETCFYTQDHYQSFQKIDPRR